MGAADFGGKDYLVAECGRLRVDIQGVTATLNGKLLPLTLPQFKALALLAVRYPKAVALKEIADLLATDRKSAGRRRQPKTARQLDLKAVIGQVCEKIRVAGGGVEIIAVPGNSYQLVAKEPATRKEAKPKPPAFGVVFIGPDLRCGPSLVQPACRRMLGGVLEASLRPEEATKAIEERTFPKDAGLILIQPHFPPQPGEPAPIYDAPSLVQQIQGYGVQVPTIAIGDLKRCCQEGLRRLKGLGVVVEPDRFGVQANNAFSLFLRIQQVLANQPPGV